MNVTPLTIEIVKRYFPSEAIREEVITLLQRECSDTVWERTTPVEMERLWFAVLKLSNGNMIRLKREVREAQIDYRDVLMAADFGGDVNEHKRWAASFLSTPSRP